MVAPTLAIARQWDQLLLLTAHPGDGDGRIIPLAAKYWRGTNAACA